MIKNTEKILNREIHARFRIYKKTTWIRHSIRSYNIV